MKYTMEDIKKIAAILSMVLGAFLLFVAIIVSISEDSILKYDTFFTIWANLSVFTVSAIIFLVAGLIGYLTSKNSYWICFLLAFAYGYIIFVYGEIGFENLFAKLCGGSALIFTLFYSIVFRIEFSTPKDN